MTTPFATSTTDSQMHNNIMAASSRDHPPMLASRRYAHWRSWFLRYIDTRPNGDALKKCILEGPYTFSTVVEAIHLILTGIGDEIYSTVDACKTAQEIWEAIKRLQQGELLNIQDVKTNLFWEFGKFTSLDGETMESYYTRFVTIVKQQHKLDEVSYHKLFDILKQYQKEVNELHDERIARNANPLALVATAQSNQDPYYQTPKSHKPYAPTSKASIPTRSHATTRNKGKEIAKPITPPSESAFEKDSDPEQAQRDKDMQKNLAHIAKYFKNIYKPTNNNLKNFFKLQKQKYMNEEIDEQELEAHYSSMAKIQEVPTANSGTNFEPLEHVQYDVGYNVFANEIQHYESIRNTRVVEMDDKCDDGRVALANLIANLKLDVDENKKIQKQLKKANASLTHELTECKSILAETSRTLGESNSIRDSCLVTLQTKQTEFEKYKACNDRTVDYDKLKHKLNETLRLLAQKDIDIKEGLKLKAYGISVVKEKHDELVKQGLLTKSHYEGLVKEKIKIVQLILFIVDFGCTKQLTGNISMMCNFVEKYLGTVRFGLNENLFSVGQFCDADLEVDFQKSTCFVRDLQGNDLLIGNRGSDLYAISLQEMTSSTLICLIAKASPTQAWLWHRRLSHLNFDYINLLLKKDVVIGLPKLKYVKDQLCSSCEVSKAKRSSFKTKIIPSLKGWLNLLHIDLCGPMRVASINGKKYNLVIVDDYSRYTWILFLSSKDETPEVLKDFLMMIQRNLQASVITVRSDRGTEFLTRHSSHSLKKKELSIKLLLLEHLNRMALSKDETALWLRLLERCSASKLYLFFWAEAIATACYTQNRSIIIPTHEKTAYHIINDRKPSIKHLHIFGCTCYLTRDGKNLDKMKEKGDPCILMSETSVANDTSSLVPQRQKASDYDNSDPIPQIQIVNKSSYPIDNSKQRDTPPTTNIQSTTEPTIPTTANAEENNDNQAEDKFNNPFCTPVREVDESSSRNIAKVYAQEKGIDFEESFALEEVYVAQPDGFVDPGHPEKVYRLRKALYGLKQAPRAWYDELSNFLISEGFTKDVDHAGCIDTRKSTSGGIQFLGDKLVSWMSKKQDCTAMSSAEAEYVALSSAIAISCNPVHHSRTKNIHTQYHFIKEHVENGIIELYFIITEYQLANMFTKALPEDRLKYLVKRIGMSCLTPAKLEVLANESA
nr:hypothetical protein [Tanacetum cinerariifolium]